MPPRKFAIATTRRSFATNFGSTLYCSAFLRRCNVDSASLKTGRCLTGIVSEPTKFERIHQLPRYTSIFFFCGNMGCGLRSQACPSQGFTSSELLNSIIVFSEPCVTDKIDRECSSILVSCASFGVDSQCDILDPLLFLSVSVTVWPTFPNVKVWNREEIHPART